MFFAVFQLNWWIYLLMDRHVLLPVITKHCTLNRMFRETLNADRTNWEPLKCCLWCMYFIVKKNVLYQVWNDGLSFLLGLCHCLKITVNRNSFSFMYTNHSFYKSKINKNCPLSLTYPYSDTRWITNDPVCVSIVLYWFCFGYFFHYLVLWFSIGYVGAGLRFLNQTH